MDAVKNQLDDQAKRELEQEAEAHRRGLSGLTVRDTAGVVTEANRHFNRVREIMRGYARRAPSAANGAAG